MLIAGLVAYLLTQTSVTSVVTSASGDIRIQPIPAPVDVDIAPCVTLQSPSDVSQNANDGPVGEAEARVVFDCLAPRYLDARNLALAIKLLFNSYSGTLPDGTIVESAECVNLVDRFDDGSRVLHFCAHLVPLSGLLTSTSANRAPRTVRRTPFFGEKHMTASKGFTGKGTVFSSATTSTGTFTPVAQLKTVQFGGRKVNFDDISNLGSPLMGTSAVPLKESMPATADPGTLDLAGIFLPGDAGKQALDLGFSSQELLYFKVQLPLGPGQSTAGNLYAFNGYIAEDPLPDIQWDKVTTMKVNISSIPTLRSPSDRNALKFPAGCGESAAATPSAV